MSACLETLSPLTSRLLARRAGLHGAAPQSLARAARALHIGVPAARRLERRGLALLRLTYSAGGCSGSSGVSQMSAVLPVSAVVPSTTNPNPSVAMLSGLPAADGGTLLAAAGSATPSAASSPGGVKGVTASGGQASGGRPGRTGKSNQVPPAAAVADGRDSPARSLADNSALLLLAALLAIGAGLALIGGQFATRRRRGRAAPTVGLSEAFAAAVAAPARTASSELRPSAATPRAETTPSPGAAPAEEAAPPAKGARPEEAAPPEEAVPPAEGATPEKAAPPEEAAWPDDMVAPWSGHMPADEETGGPGETAPPGGAGPPEETTSRTEAAPRPPSAPTPRPAPSSSHRPAVRPRQATVAGAALTVLGALLSARRRR
jgi:hypothetical protein